MVPQANPRGASEVRDRYLLHLPAGYQNSRPYPLLFAFHPAEQTASKWREELRMGSPIGGEAIIVYPEGNIVTWDVARDLEYFDDLLSQLLSQYCVDQDRIFVVGDGFGALFGSMLACERGDQLRAAALFSPVPPPSACRGGLAVLIGQKAEGAPPRVEAALAARDFWARQNQCSPDSIAPSIAGCFEYQQCHVGALRYCEYDDDASLSALAATAIWDFFVRQ